MKDAGGVGAGSGGEDFSDQRGRDSPFAADAEGHEEAEEGDVPQVGGEERESGEDGVEEDGQGHDRLAAETVGERTKDDAPQRAAEQEDRQKPVAPESDGLRLVSRAEQICQELAAGDIEELPFEGIEGPAGRGDGEDQPLVSCDF